jgi:hypothetical protein
MDDKWYALMETDVEALRQELEKEYKLIKEKQSKLSAKDRAYIVELFEQPIKLGGRNGKSYGRFQKAEHLLA